MPLDVEGEREPGGKGARVCEVMVFEAARLLITTINKSIQYLFIVIENYFLSFYSSSSTFFQNESI